MESLKKIKISLKPCFLQQGMFSHIVLTRWKENHRVLGTSISNDYTSVIKSTNMTSNSRENKKGI